MKVILSINMQTCEGTLFCFIFFCHSEEVLRDTNEVGFYQGLLLKVKEVERDWYFLKNNNLTTGTRNVAR